MRAITLLLCLGLAAGCITHRTEDATTTLVGKGRVTETCTEVDGTNVCETKVEGDGFSENAVTVFVKALEVVVELPGRVVRGAGGVLP